MNKHISNLVWQNGFFDLGKVFWGSSAFLTSWNFKKSRKRHETKDHLMQETLQSLQEIISKVWQDNFSNTPCNLSFWHMVFLHLAIAVTVPLDQSKSCSRDSFKYRGQNGHLNMQMVAYLRQIDSTRLPFYKGFLDHLPELSQNQHFLLQKTNWLLVIAQLMSK